LGEADDDEETDLKAWIKKTKKRERELAVKKAQELEIQDKQYQDEYSSGSIPTSTAANFDLENLEGLRVGHDIGEIEEGEGVILTIKDRGVLDDDGNSNLLPC
jgi:U4/U6.U5 tri-snRNP-associated protein 1